MNDLIGSIAREGAAFVIPAGLLVYAVLVLHRYTADGPSSPVSFDLRNPLRSAERFLVGLGVWMVGVFLRAAKSTLELLYEASADVGEWFFRQTNPSVQDRFRSRF